MRVFVKFFAEENLGDDLFLKILLERYPDIQFVILAKEHYKKIFRDYKNLIVVNDNLTTKSKKIGYRLNMVFLRNFFPDKYKSRIQTFTEKLYKDEFIKSDAFVSIGGSIFIQPKLLPFYQDIILYDYVNQVFKKTFFIGCNFGPYNDPSYKSNYIEIFKQATDVCFREKASYDEFKDLSNVRWKPDVVFSLKVTRVEKIKKSVGFSIVSPRDNTNPTEYINKYVELIKFASKSPLIILILIPEFLSTSATT